MSGWTLARASLVIGGLLALSLVAGPMGALAQAPIDPAASVAGPTAPTAPLTAPTQAPGAQARPAAPPAATPALVPAAPADGAQPASQPVGSDGYILGINDKVL